MNTQAILKLIDKKIGENEFGNGICYSEDYCNALKDLKKEISSLPSLDIDTLQRYDSFEYKHGVKMDNGEYIRYDDLKKLLGR